MIQLKQTDGLSARQLIFATGLPLMAQLVPRAPADLPPKAAAIIFMSHMPVRGRIEPLFFGI